MEHFAHTGEGEATSEWEPLDAHLRLVADGGGDLPGAGGFAAAFGARQWGRLAGLWHDVGKYSEEFQAYLRSGEGGDAHLESRAGRVDHSTAGAQHAAEHVGGRAGQLLAYCIAGHHGGLPDNVDPNGGESGLASRLGKPVCDWSAAPAELLNQAHPHQPAFDWVRTSRSRAAFQGSVFCRMLFSCLVDADYLATETFVRPDEAAERPCAEVTPGELVRHLDAHLEKFTADTAVNQGRAAVLKQCREKAELPPGLFSLTVPTGGGKTLSSLAFGLRHADRYALRRVIYAIPFTSIIEQNAQVFADVLSAAGPGVVLEHHSSLDPQKETRWSRLAAENWDAPVVVTTNVQLLESLFDSRPSRCRKLHRIARSVIILDECQALPVTLLAPTLSMLEELCRNYGCTVVLCSATQPAVQERQGFPIGLTGVREIVEDPAGLHETLRRVEVTRLGRLDDDEVVERLRGHEQVLCVVNTRAHAARLFAGLRESSDDAEGVFHLSAQMCARHRSAVLRLIRWRLGRGAACRVISTQLVEAGVDVDFPVVYRAMTGLDSIAQAAGRCNREGRLRRGQVFVFDTDVDPCGDLRARRQMGEEVARLHENVLGLDAIEHFFRLTYWSRSGEWDKENILACFALSGGGPHFQFREAAERYRLIPDSQQPVIVPYGRRGRELVEQLRRMPEPPGRGFDRRVQRYVVGLYGRDFNRLCENQVLRLYHERFWVLQNQSAYHAHLGLTTDAAGFDPGQLCI